MDEPVTSHRHIPALDGLRALAVVAVIAYHLGLGWAGGGYLGVDLFFVLSGYLITGLLLEERGRTGTIRLGAFWARRARRLLPALLLVLGAIALYAALGGPGVNRGALRGDGLAALFYAANWHFIAGHSTYFAQFTTPSPLEHTWSLAIEEQFYLLWPLLLLVLLRAGGRRWRPLAVTVTAVVAVASATAMALLSAGNVDVTRAYFGTDTRAFELMAGALAAMAVSGRGAPGRRATQVLRMAGPLALAALVTGWCVLGGPPRWMFHGGFVVAAALGALVVLSVSCDARGPFGRALSWRPVVWVGAISYGLYLWHWPVFVAVTRSTTGMPGWAVDAVRLAVTVTLATASYYLVERPVRRHGLAGWRRVLAPTAVGVTAAAVLAATAPVAAAGAAAPPAPGTSAVPVVFHVPPPAGRPLRVMLMGDSVMDQTTSAFTAAFAAAGGAQVQSVAFPGWGLARDPNALAELADAVAHIHPDVVIGTWSWDWQRASADPVAYRALLERALATLLAPGDGVHGVVLLSFPRNGPLLFQSAAQSAATEKARQRWNAIAAAEAAAHPGTVAFLPVADTVALDGRFSPWLPSAAGTWVRVRALDGVHLCPAGAARYVGAVLADVHAAWSLPAPSGAWWNGPWVHDGKYEIPPGNCPDDHPSASFVRSNAAVARRASQPLASQPRASQPRGSQPR